MNRKKMIWGCITAFFMMVIFLLSNQSGVQSTYTSAFFVPLFDSIGISEYGVRKMAHMFIFGCLSVSSYQLWKRISYTIVFCFFYACVDEWHQLFIAQRSGNPLDVIFDTLGAILFLFLFLLIRKNRISR